MEKDYLVEVIAFGQVSRQRYRAASSKAAERQARRACGVKITVSKGKAVAA